jgi:hypothetical protein
VEGSQPWRRALAFAQLAPDLTYVTVVAPNIELVDRPMIVPAQVACAIEDVVRDSLAHRTR